MWPISLLDVNHDNGVANSDLDSHTTDLQIIFNLLMVCVVSADFPSNMFGSKNVHTCISMKLSCLNLSLV